VLNGGNDAALATLLTDPERPLVDRTYMEAHPPGSTFKTLVAYAALEEGIATPETKITSTGAIYIQDEFDPAVVYTFRDWAAHGTTDMYQGLARSSDVYFYYLAGGYRSAGVTYFEGLGATRLADYARQIGLGEPTGLDLPGEVAGLVPDPEWKSEAVGDPWFLGDTYTFGIGQGYLTVSPMQMAVLAAAIANDGDVLQPRLVRGTRVDGELIETPRVVRTHLDNGGDSLAVIREAMRITAGPTGTAWRGQPAGLTIGGKTGTAEFGAPYPDGKFDTHGWYIGFAPFEDPEIAVAVYVEHGVGSTHAGPVARAMFEHYFGLAEDDQ
jgi:penicillin-binding protein 2